MLQRKISYRLIDEDGHAANGITMGPDDVRQFVERLRKEHRDQFIYAELMDEWDDGELDEQLLDGLD